MSNGKQHSSISTCSIQPCYWEGVTFCIAQVKTRWLPEFQQVMGPSKTFLITMNPSMCCTKSSSKDILEFNIYTKSYCHQKIKVIIRTSWCNGYRRRKWTRRHESKSRTRHYISHSTNILGKGMNPIILPPAMGKIVGQTRFFSLGETTSLGEIKTLI